jgi:hypothetical protein
MVYAIEVIAMIAALGAIGGFPALLSALINYARFATRYCVRTFRSLNVQLVALTRSSGLSKLLYNY